MSCTSVRHGSRQLNRCVSSPRSITLRHQPRIQLATITHRSISNGTPGPRTRTVTSILGKTTTALLLLGGLGLAVYYDPLALAPTSSSSLNSTSFTPYKLISTDRVSSTSVIFTLRAPKTSELQNKDTATKVWTENPGVWSVEIKQPQLMIARAYTPLPPVALPFDESEDSSESPQEDQNTDIRLLIRREPHGEVSRYMHALPLGSRVELRGPFTEYQLPENVNTVVFVAGGTGVAPALQIVHTLAQKQKRDQERTAIQILWANRMREECIGGAKEIQEAPLAGQAWSGFYSAKDMQSPQAQAKLQAAAKGPLVQQLDGLRSGNSDNQDVGVKYFVDEEGSVIRLEDLKRSLDLASTSTGPASEGRRLVIVSGPEGFINYVCGPKRLLNGVETQGSVGGLLSTLDLRGWNVWKL